MSVTDEQKSPWMIHREHHHRAFANFVVVQVSSIGPRRAGGWSEVTCWRNAYTSEHRLGWKLEFDARCGRFAQANCLPLQINIPWHKVGSAWANQIVFVTIRIESFNRFRCQ